MIDSALGLDPDDNSEEAKAKRRLRNLADLDGITFVAKIAVEPNNDPRYPDQNKLDRPVLPNEKGWRAVMNGEELPPSPSRPRSAKNSAGNTPATGKPAWGQQAASTAQHAATAAGQRPATPPLGQDAGSSQPAKPAGPAWLNQCSGARDGSGEASSAAPAHSASAAGAIIAPAWT
jgi:hypothetical protein